MALIIAGFISFAVYLIYMLIFSAGLTKRNNNRSFVKRTVSIVVAARNEEKNILNLLTGLVNQSYPKELFEVIIINDRSTDSTAETVARFSEKWEHIRIINIEKTPPAYSPKKYALTQGIAASAKEIILLTDADCLVNKYWIEAMISNFDDDTDLVAGFSRTRISKWEKTPLFARFEFFDFLVMFIAAAGAILSGKAFSCSNQNLAYRRSSFLKVGGFDRIKKITSGDDVNLLQLFRIAKMKITFSLIPHTFVYTKPVTGWTQLFNQRSRWASNSKWQLLLNFEFFVYLCAVFVLNCSLLIGLFFNWSAVLLLFLLKLVAEFVFVSAHFSKFEQERKRLAFLLLWAVIQPFYIITVTVLGIFDIFVWKKN